MDRDEFRRHGHALVDWISEYLDHSDVYPVLAQVSPGRRPQRAARHLRRIAVSRSTTIWADFERILVPALTHWNHPGFFAYFAISSSPPAVLAEFLAAAVNQQAMLWRTSPAATELENVALALAATAARAARRHSRGSSTTPRRSPRCTGWPPRAKRPAPLSRAAGLAARPMSTAARVLLRTRPLVGGQGGHPARPRPGARAAGSGRRGSSPCAWTRCAAQSRRTSPTVVSQSPSSRPSERRR